MSTASVAASRQSKRRRDRVRGPGAPCARAVFMHDWRAPHRSIPPAWHMLILLFRRDRATPRGDLLHLVRARFERRDFPVSMTASERPGGAGGTAVTEESARAGRVSAAPADGPETGPGLVGFVRTHSRREQIGLLLLTALSFPVVYLSLEVPKIIVHDAISGTGFPRSVAGVEIGQIPYLLMLCLLFLGLVVVINGFKWVINVGVGMAGERLLRRMRFELADHVARVPMRRLRGVRQGETIQAVMGEIEPPGGFFGEVLVTPAFQGGLLAVYMAFIFVQDLWPGLAAIAFHPVQSVPVAVLQARIVRLNRARGQCPRRGRPERRADLPRPGDPRQRHPGLASRAALGRAAHQHVDPPGDLPAQIHHQVSQQRHRPAHAVLLLRDRWRAGDRRAARLRRAGCRDRRLHGPGRAVDGGAGLCAAPVRLHGPLPLRARERRGGGRDRAPHALPRTRPHRSKAISRSGASPRIPRRICRRSPRSTCRRAG